ncbi:MAG: peptidylprolyl isomerase [Xanthomonadaceae bacterium]|nr:peptidylprolyl isomerase [Xanthomonadaceae bacterium]MDP2185815.1 peptidylprolyl isomerase [Xanthomonadales bacterium]MDZ4114634.1 peptidylprolyl isomerase [Xanthomonadaceae bacterium]MDZ4378242.1 peptidylprolyl isomerase [Xanthomonadaceae bacterium]
MRNALSCVLFSALCAIGFDARAQALSLEPIEGIAAVVDEEVILSSELQRATNNFLAQFAGNQQQLPPRNVLERQILDRLVLSRLQIERANAMGIRISDAELDQAVQSVAANNRITIDQLRSQLASEGLNFDQFRRDLRNEILIQRLRQRIVQGRVAVSDTEIELALAAQGNNRELHLAHILVALPDGATPEQVTTAKSKIEGVKALIDKGEMDFTAAAIRYSDAPNALQGGDLEWRGQNEIPNLFTNVVAAMQPGDVSDPIRGPTGFQLIQLIETRDAGRQKITEYKSRHLMIRQSEVVSFSQAKAKLGTLRERALKGESFEALAREYSEDTATRDAGGEMDWYEKDAWGAGVAAQIVKLKDDEISQPFQSDVGWHMIQRIGERETDVTDTLRRNQVRELIARRKGEEEFERFIRQLRSEAFVDMRISS